MEDGIKDGQEKAAQLINDLQDISFTKIGLIVAGTWIAIALAHRVLPDATAVEVLPALLRTGFLAQREGWLSVQPAAYPAVRRALLADGFPMGEI